MQTRTPKGPLPAEMEVHRTKAMVRSLFLSRSTAHNSEERSEAIDTRKYKYDLDSLAHEWTHTTLCISTPIPFGKGTFTPSLNYQISMEDTINEDNELYALLAYKISF